MINAGILVSRSVQMFSFARSMPEKTAKQDKAAMDKTAMPIIVASFTKK